MKTEGCAASEKIRFPGIKGAKKGEDVELTVLLVS